MAKIKTIEIDKEPYCSVNDLLKVLKASKNTKEVIELLEPKKDKKGLGDLSDFNKKLKKGLDWNPNN